MKKLIQKPPYSVGDENQALLLARYLIEDNQEDYLDLNLELKATPQQIISVFKQAIGEVIIYEDEQERQLWEDLTSSIQKFQFHLKQYVE